MQRKDVATISLSVTWILLHSIQRNVDDNHDTFYEMT